MQREVVLIGYSGHSYVVCDILKSAGKKNLSYCEIEEKILNPFRLRYIGSEQNANVLKKIAEFDVFVATGDNATRKKIYNYLFSNAISICNAIHASAIVSDNVKMGTGIMIAAGAIVNPLSEIGNGVICNTGSIIEHECIIGDFVHVAPAAVLCGNVKVGENSFIGANSVVKQGLTIGKNVLIGAGSVVINDIPDNYNAWGNPAKIKK